MVPAFDVVYFQNVPNSCLPQTIVNYDQFSCEFYTNYELWINIRGQLVDVLSDSAKNLVKRGYLVEKHTCGVDID